MTKEEVVQEIKNSLIDAEDIDHKLEANDLFDLTNKIIGKFDVRVQKLNNIVAYIEMTLKYAGCAGWTSSDSTEELEIYIDHITKVERLDDMDRCYILTKITRDKHVTCYAGQIIARGLFKSIEW